MILHVPVKISAYLDSELWINFRPVTVKFLTDIMHYRLNQLYSKIHLSFLFKQSNWKWNKQFNSIVCTNKIEAQETTADHLSTRAGTPQSCARDGHHLKVYSLWGFCVDLKHWTLFVKFKNIEDLQTHLNLCLTMLLIWNNIALTIFQKTKTLLWHKI